MSTGGRLLTGSDRVKDNLVSHVSRHVVSETRKTFATGPLGLSITEYGHIEEDKQFALERNLEVSN